MADPMGDSLRRTADAVDRYGVPEKMIAVAARSLTPMAQQPRTLLEVDALLDAIVGIADAHEGPCGDCRMCTAIRNALAVAMGVIRAETDLGFQRMYDEPQAGQ